MTVLMVVELLIVLVALWIGARYGSLALGAISGIGLAILVFGFQLKPGTPPTDVIYIIIAAVTCAGMLQASGGMDWMIQIAEKMLRKHPDRITLLAPFTTFFLTVLVGTGHVVYTLMPIICDIALKKGIRPERPLRHCLHRLADRYHLLAHRCRRGRLRVHLCRQRLQREQHPDHHGYHPRLYHRYPHGRRLQLAPSSSRCSGWPTSSASTAGCSSA